MSSQTEGTSAFGLVVLAIIILGSALTVDYAFRGQRIAESPEGIAASKLAAGTVVCDKTPDVVVVSDDGPYQYKFFPTSETKMEWLVLNQGSDAVEQWEKISHSGYWAHYKGGKYDHHWGADKELPKVVYDKLAYFRAARQSCK